MRIISIALGCFVLALVGCATPTYNYKPEAVSISEPPIDSTNTTQVGDEMLMPRTDRRTYAFRQTDPAAKLKMISIERLTN